MLGCCCCCCWKGQILHHIHCWRVQRTWWVHGDYELYVVVAWLPHGQCIDVTALTAQAVIQDIVWMHYAAIATARSCMSLPCLQTRGFNPAETPNERQLQAYQTEVRFTCMHTALYHPGSLTLIVSHQIKSTLNCLPCLGCRPSGNMQHCILRCQRLFSSHKPALQDRVMCAAVVIAQIPHRQRMNSNKH
jgi:hypothetical protein